MMKIKKQIFKFLFNLASIILPFLLNLKLVPFSFIRIIVGSSISYSGSEKTLIANGNVVPGLKYTEKIVPYFLYVSIIDCCQPSVDFFSPTISKGPTI